MSYLKKALRAAYERLIIIFLIFAIHFAEAIMKIFLKILLHPLLCPMYTIMGIYAFVPDYLGEDPFLNLISIFFLSTLLPAVAMGMMRLLGLSRKNTDNPRLDQIGPLLVVAVFYLWLFKNLHGNADIDPLVRQLFLGACISLFLGFFVNLFEQVQFHFIGLGYLASSFTSLFLNIEGNALALPLGEQVVLFQGAIPVALVLFICAAAYLAFLHTFPSVKPKSFAGHWFIGFAGPFIGQLF